MPRKKSVIETVRRGQPDLFSGGGEMGTRMRSIDWSTTPLGPVEVWPQSLKTCVRIILTSRQPMFVWWGDALINLYNDAYRSIVGGKHPAALGQPASLVWREIWDQIGPRAQSAIRLNEGTYSEAELLIMERYGYQEETYYTFSYSPVRNDSGGVGGIICANTDDTQRIINARQLDLLRVLAARTADARTCEDACMLSAAALESNAWDLPFACVYLVDPDRGAATLASTAGISRSHPAAPAVVSLDGEGRRFWPFAAALRAHAPVIVDDLVPSFPRLPSGGWQQPPRRAAIVPIAASGPTGRAGLLVVGLNPHRLFDDQYRGFLGLVSGQISASIANARAHEEEKQRAEALAAIDRAKTTFFSNVSHEFRTPLTLMLGPLEDALAQPEPTLERESLKTTYRNALRLLRLVNALLDFSRIEAGRARARYEPVDLSAVTGELTAVFRSAVERAGLALVVKCDPLPEPVYVDREMWEKIVLNLLSNAFKFTFAGTIEVHLRAVAGARVELVVRDTGIGVAPHEVPRLFERFYQVEGARARTHEGSGVGLALVQELVRMHGGEIRAESKLGEGTTFTVTLRLGTKHLPRERVHTEPLVARAGNQAVAYVQEALRWLPDELAAPTPPDGPPAADPEPISDSGQTRRPWILVADDNADMRGYVTRLLRQRWDVTAVSNGTEALKVVRTRKPDLVITDVMMPELDGFGLLRELRGDSQTRSVPVVMLSARAGEESRLEGLRAGADDYLIKPFSARELLARVSIHLQMGGLRTRLEQQRALLADLFRRAPLALAVIGGPDLVFEVTNPAFQETISRKAVPGAPLLAAIPEIAGQGFDERLREVLHTGQPHAGREVVLRLDRRGTGELEETYWTFLYTPLRNELGDTDRVLAICNEVTEQVQARRKLELLANEAAQANRAKDEFLAMLGHELRNPLSPILTALQLLRMRGNKATELSVIERQVGQMVRLVDDLLDVSRITRGRIDLRKERLELATVVARAVEIASPLFEQRQQQLAVQVPAQGLMVDGDAARLAQVVSNLLTNASKYSDVGGRIHVSAARVGGDVELRVRDQGIGIAPHMLGGIFDLFVQQPQALDRAKGGLGLGLAIVRSLVGLHGGKVRAESEGPGRGSEFVVTLPFVGGDAASAESTDGTGARPGMVDAPAQVTSTRVLVVDDNQDAATTLAEGLAAVGYDVKIAHDGPSALDVARAFRPHVCLLDIGLPVMDGYELARRLRAEQTLPNPLRLVAVTGYGQESDRSRSERAGFNAHLVKPVSFELLTRVVAS